MSKSTKKKQKKKHFEKKHKQKCRRVGQNDASNRYTTSKRKDVIKNEGGMIFMRKSLMWEYGSGSEYYYNLEKSNIVIWGIMEMKQCSIPVFRLFCICKDNKTFRVYYNRISLSSMMPSLMSFKKLKEQIVKKMQCYSRKSRHAKRLSTVRKKQQSQQPQQQSYTDSTRMPTNDKKRHWSSVCRWYIFGVILGTLLGSGALITTVASGGSFAIAMNIGIVSAYSGGYAGIAKGIYEEYQIMNMEKKFKNTKVDISTTWRYRSRRTYSTIHIAKDGNITLNDIHNDRHFYKICAYAISPSYSSSYSLVDTKNENDETIDKSKNIKNGIESITLSYNDKNEVLFSRHTVEDNAISGMSV